MSFLFFWGGGEISPKFSTLSLSPSNLTPVNLQLASLPSNTQQLAIPITAQQLLHALLVVLELPLDAEQSLLGRTGVPDLDLAVVTGGEEEMLRRRVRSDQWD